MRILHLSAAIMCALGAFVIIFYNPLDLPFFLAMPISTVLLILAAILRLFTPERKDPRSEASYWVRPK